MTWFRNTLALTLIVAALWPQNSFGQHSDSAVNEVRVVSDATGQRLQVDGRDFMVFGMNWGYVPIGTNYSYDFWGQPEDMIRDALATEMGLLQGMGVNAIRQYVGIPPKWITYIYENYGIYTILNHTVARYGYTLDGVWSPSVDYSDPRLREAVTEEVMGYVRDFKDTPGLLMWLLGNENNYGLSWSSFEIEALPEGERNAARARHLYSLFGEITSRIQDADSNHPVAIANGDLQYIDVIVEECGHMDIMGSNVYRGISARDFYQVVKDKLGVPTFFTEFGADAFNARTMKEDQLTQARYLLGQWEEIYEQSAGKGRVGNAIGGIVFQWSDGWWKFGQEDRLDIHDTNASWPNAGYPEDFVEGQNNMNEEWWGIAAKGLPDQRGIYDVYPRAAYYVLRDAWSLDPYAPGTDLQAIRSHFGRIHPMSSVLTARADKAALGGTAADKFRVKGLRLQFETINTGGDRITTPEDAPDTPTEYPAFQGFDHLQSFYADFEAKPSDNVIGNLSLSILGNVPTNPIDEIFYENRGRPTSVSVDGSDIALEGLERVRVYGASVDWEDPNFKLNAFYRVGHYHWADEGDFFGLYREAYYGENIDIYNGIAPVGVELAGRRAFDGFTVAFGPELWWGANPALLFKYNRRVGPFDTTFIFHEDIAKQSRISSTFAVPVPETRKASLQVKGARGSIGYEVGGLWSGDTRVGEQFYLVEEVGDSYNVYVDNIKNEDTLGGKIKLTWQKGRWNWYGQAAYMGLVAEAGPTAVTTFTGWHLKDSGSGNQKNVITGLAATFGSFQISPNFLWQKPIVGPIPNDVPAPGRPRNVLDDPFTVRANRETVGTELLITYDPTPATWMWQWDNDTREDASFAASLGFVHRHHPTTQDAGIGILEDGETPFAFPGAPPARDLYEIHSRMVSSAGRDMRLVAHLYVGTGEANGSDPRKITRFGGDARLAWKNWAFESFAKFDDWGPYDYHRDFNYTFPIQLMGDVSYNLGLPKWYGLPQTRFGVRGLYRTLDQYNPRYCPIEVLSTDGLICDPLAPGDDGNEWEIRTYVELF